MIKINNKLGQTTILLFVLILAFLFGAILLFIGGVIVQKTNNALNQDVDIGQVNLATINSQTFGQFTTTYLDNADWWGISLIFGMIFGLFLSSYLLRNRFPKWGIVMDMFIIFTVFIFSLYLSSTYVLMLETFNDIGEDFLEVYAPKTSMFIKNLPIFVVVVGVISMVLLHSSIPRKSEERYQEGGFLQGAY